MSENPVFNLPCAGDKANRDPGYGFRVVSEAGRTPEMFTFIVRRILYSIPVLIVSTFLSFTFISLAGDPTANLRANPGFSTTTMAHLRHEYHLDRSIPVRYAYWIDDAVTHKLGRSLRTGQPIWPDITRTLGHTLQIVLLSETLAILLGVAVGIYSAIRQYSF